MQRLTSEVAVMVGLALPTGIWQGQQVLFNDTLLRVEDLQRIVQGKTDPHGLAAQAVGHAVAVAADLDVAVPGHQPVVEIDSIETMLRQPGERRLLVALEAFADDLAMGAMSVLDLLLVQLLRQLLVEVGEGLEHLVTGEEVGWQTRCWMP